jgi:uncharacterized protein (TIGR00661 family)
MKILYAVQATGNGHLSRANEILPYLQSYGEIDVFVSGDMSSIDLQYPVKFRSKGLSLRWKQCGNIDFLNTARGFEFRRLRREVKDLPVEDYDLVINDFEYISALACRNKGVPCVQLSHQASFISEKTPRPPKRSKLGEVILKRYAPSKINIGLHFDAYDDFIHGPVIRRDVKFAHSSDQGHICVYLPSYPIECFIKFAEMYHDFEFHIFSPYVDKPAKINKCHFFKPSLPAFTSSMLHSTGVITGGGFETPSEALYLNKKLISIPIRNHYEQQCNAAALKMLNVEVLNSLDELRPDLFYNWIKNPKQHGQVKDSSVTMLIEKSLNAAFENSNYILDYSLSFAFL